MTLSDLANELSILRERGGFCAATDYGLIELYGADIQRFLQSQTTNDVKELKEESSQMTCLLDRKAHIQAYFELFRRHDSYRIIAERTQIPAILKHLEEFRFADKVEFLDLSETGKFLAVQGPWSMKTLAAGLHGNHQPLSFDHCLCDKRLWNSSVHIFKKSITGDDGLFVWVSNRDFDTLLENVQKACQAAGMTELSHELLEIARMEAGLAKFGTDFSHDNFLPETGLDATAVSYTKGCFLGQEVLARVRAQGAPTRGLMGLLFPENAHIVFPLDTKILLGDEVIGWLRSNIYSPTLKRTIALAFVKRDYRVPDQTLNVDVAAAPSTVTVTTLPFVKIENSLQRAKRLYESALATYAREIDVNENSDSIKKLREALELEPKFEDAYEALGVILSKCGRLDEAIELMKRLADLNPESVMAHTNLSVFYVDKGMIEMAEEEKAISMSIRMKQAAAQVNLQKKTEEEDRQRKQEALDRMDMFKEVLSLDNDDLMANYGVGSCYVALEEYESAIPFLLKAIEVKPSHTVAYLSLAEAYEGLNRLDDAVKAYRDGISVASKRGDMTPLKQMQQRLHELEASSKVV